jgi:hypothetical protein
MCYTATTSLYSFCIGFISSLVLLFIGLRNRSTQSNQSNWPIIIGGFFLFVSLMQLYDYLFWTHSPTSAINQMATKAAILTNHLQPILLFCLIWIVSSTVKGERKIGTWSKWIIGLYTIAIIPYTILCLKRVKYTTVTAESNPSLYWGWNHQSYASVIYVLFLASLILTFYENIKVEWVKWTAVLATIGTFLFTYIKYNKQLASGRFWCYAAAFVPLYFIIGKVIMEVREK